MVLFVSPSRALWLRGESILVKREAAKKRRIAVHGLALLRIFVPSYLIELFFVSAWCASRLRGESVF
jgi:hypothetical protein